MSNKTFDWVWEHSEARARDRLVLLAIADEADDPGYNGRPSQRRIAQKVREPQRSVRRSIERLEGAGELLVQRPDKPAPGRHNRYFLVMGRDPQALAEQIGWPAPRLDPIMVAEWEQLTLETLQMRAQHASEGYTMRFRGPPAVGYPQLGENSEDEAATGADRGVHDDSVPGHTGAPRDGTDPLTPSSNRKAPPTTLQRPTTEQTAAVLAADDAQADAATLTPEQVHALVAQAKGQITEVRSEGDDAGPASPQGSQPPGPEADDGSRAPQEAVEAVEGDLGGETDALAVEDRWAERADLR